MTGIGFCAPPLARTYWNMGPGPDYADTDHADTDHGKEWSAAPAKTCVHNLYHVVRPIRENPIPPK